MPKHIFELHGAITFKRSDKELFLRQEASKKSLARGVFRHSRGRGLRSSRGQWGWQDDDEFDLLATLHPLTTGEVLWQDESIYNNLLEYRRIVGFSPQKPNLDKGVELRKILMISGRCYGLSAAAAAARADELVEQLGLQEYVKSFVEHLSGGYRQRFLIARALMHSPQLVILDEPTVGLDPHIRRDLWEVIRGLRGDNITVLLTTHYLDEAECLSDRVCLLHEGTIRTIDTPKNLVKIHQKNNLEEVFLKFVDDPGAELFNSVSVDHD